MPFLANIKIGSRLGAGFAILLFLLSAVGGIGLFQSSHIYDGTRQIGEHWLPREETLGAVSSLSDDVRRTALLFLVTTDGKDRQVAREQHTQSIAQFATMLDGYSKLVSSPEEPVDLERTTWIRNARECPKVGLLEGTVAK